MRNLLRLILPLLMLQGCAGNPVAQQLERSFDQPAVTSSGSDPSDRSERTRDSKPESKQQPTSKSTSKARSQATSEPTSKTDPPTAADTRPENAPTEQDRSDKPELKADQAGDDQGGDDQTEDNKAADNKAADNKANGNDQEKDAQEAKDAVELPPSDLPQEPYRITIRLSAADPASPAETVTRVLREAGVPFSVERIERVEP